MIPTSLRRLISPALVTWLHAKMIKYDPAVSQAEVVQCLLDSRRRLMETLEMRANELYGTGTA